MAESVPIVFQQATSLAGTVIDMEAMKKRARFGLVDRHGLRLRVGDVVGKSLAEGLHLCRLPDAGQMAAVKAV